MEKLMLALWRPEGSTADVFRDQLLDELGAELLPQVQGLRVCVADSAVSAAAGLCQQSLCDAPDALVSVWLHSAQQRAPVEAAISARAGRISAWLVTESAPLRPQQAVGERLSGWTQVVFLQRPGRLSRDEWLDLWLDSHTRIAIDVQSNFAYRQNIVVRHLAGEDLPVDAVVEESFPLAAMDSALAFYGATDEADLQRRVRAMIDSCARFIDFECINVMPMSDYLLLEPVHA